MYKTVRFRKESFLLKAEPGEGSFTRGAYEKRMHEVLRGEEGRGCVPEGMYAIEYTIGLPGKNGFEGREKGKESPEVLKRKR